MNPRRALYTPGFIFKVLSCFSFGSRLLLLLCLCSCKLAAWLLYSSLFMLFLVGDRNWQLNTVMRLKHSVLTTCWGVQMWAARSSLDMPCKTCYPLNEIHVMCMFAKKVLYILLNAIISACESYVNNVILWNDISRASKQVLVRWQCQYAMCAKIRTRTLNAH